MPLSWLKNNTPVFQSFGRHTLEAGGVGLVPLEVVDHYKSHPTFEFTVLDNAPESWVFRHTDHRPFNARYPKHD